MEILEPYFRERSRIIDEDKPFPAFIRDLRQSLGLKMKSASKYCQMSKHQLSRLERGLNARFPKPFPFESFSVLYGVPEWIVKKKFYEYVGERQKDDSYNSWYSSAKKEA